MALRVEKTGRRSEYILKADRESSAPTKFILRPLTWEEESEAGEIKAVSPMSADQALQIQKNLAQAKDDGRDAENKNADDMARTNEIAPPETHFVNAITKQHAVRCRHGIVEILGLLDIENKPIAMSSAEFARQAPMDVICELGLQIQRITRLPDGAIKN